MLEDAAWYVEHTGMSNRELQEKRILAIETVRPHLQAIIDEFDMDKHHGSTPLASRDGLAGFVKDLPSFKARMPQSRL